MSEHEGALFDAVLALGATMLESGASEVSLRGRLTAARDAAEALGNRHGAATLEFLLSSLFPAKEPPPKPALRII